MFRAPELLVLIPPSALGFLFRQEKEPAFDTRSSNHLVSNHQTGTQS